MRTCNEYLQHNKPTGDQMDRSRFEGQWLTEYLLDYHGITRKNGEGDWNLRKRAFAEVFPSDQVAALEFLLGCRHDELKPSERKSIFLFMRSMKSPDSLVAFTRSFKQDQMLRRRSRAPH
jgi:hypothetical protein